MVLTHVSSEDGSDLLLPEHPHESCLLQAQQISLRSCPCAPLSDIPDLLSQGLNLQATSHGTVQVSHLLDLGLLICQLSPCMHCAERGHEESRPAMALMSRSCDLCCCCCCCGCAMGLGVCGGTGHLGRSTPPTCVDAQSLRLPGVSCSLSICLSCLHPAQAMLSDVPQLSHVISAGMEVAAAAYQ